MSRVAKNPITIPAGVTVTVANDQITIKGSKGTAACPVNSAVAVNVEENVIKFAPKNESIEANALAGTTRAIVSNIVIGVTKGFEIKLELVGVGYRAQAQGKKLNLSLGFSHPVAFDIPEGITIDTPSQTEILVRGVNKHLVGQVAANIRAYRRPECYKGKGIRYAGEKISLKETKKK